MGFFNSPLQDAIEKVTSEKNAELDWSLVMGICDQINQDADGPKDSIKTLKKRLDHSSWKTQQLALALLDACLKNCSVRFHHKFAKKKFQTVLKDMVHSKKVLPIVRDHLLELIETWAEAFRRTPNTMVIGETYDELKREGVQFPNRDVTSPARPPLVTPPSRLSQQIQPQMYPPQGYAQQQQGHYQPYNPTSQLAPPPVGGYPGQPQYRPQQQQHPGYAQQQVPPRPVATSEQQRKKLQDDIAVVRESINILSDALNAVNPQIEDVGRNELINEFAASCKQMRPRVQNLIETLSDEVLLMDLLVVMDNLNRVLDAHDRACRRQTIPRQDPCPPSSGPNPQEFNSEPVPSMQSSLPPPVISQQPMQHSSVSAYYQVTDPSQQPPPIPVMDSGYGGSSYVMASPAPVNSMPYTATVAPYPAQTTSYPMYPSVSSGASYTSAQPYHASPVVDSLSTNSVLIDLNDVPPRPPVRASSTTVPTSEFSALGLSPVTASPVPTSTTPPRQTTTGNIAAVQLGPAPSHLPPRRLPPLQTPQPQQPLQQGSAPLIPMTPPSMYPTVGAPSSYSQPEDDEFDSIARRHTAAQEDDEFAAIAKRHSQQPSRASEALGFAPAATESNVTEHLVGRNPSLAPESGVGSHSPGSVAAVRRSHQEYLEMRSDNLFDL